MKRIANQNDPFADNPYGFLPAKLWAVFYPDGAIVTESIHFHKKFALESFVQLMRKIRQHGNWAAFYRKGYRCARIEIKKV